MLSLPSSLRETFISLSPLSPEKKFSLLALVSWGVEKKYFYKIYDRVDRNFFVFNGAELAVVKKYFL